MLESPSKKAVLIALAFYGAWKALKCTYNSLAGLMKYFWPLARQNLGVRYGNKSWAIVTGASDGLGKHYAK